MVKKVMKKIICIAMCCIVFTGCMSNNATHSSALPDIDQFSDDLYDPGEFAFPPIVSALYIHNGETESISPEDPRLTRLLNALSYSYEKQYTAQLQGVLGKTEVVTCLESGAPMLEICFSESDYLPYVTEFAKTPRIIISANSCLVFIDAKLSPVLEDTEICANQHWPFFNPIAATMKDSDLDYHTQWANDSMINLLAYAGFD